MIVRIWDPVHCVLRVVFRTAAAARLLKPLTLGVALSCGGSAPPPPPTPPRAPTPPMLWHAPPPAFEYVPPSGTPYPIPLGPALEPPGTRWETMEDLPPIEVAERPRSEPVDAPGPVAWFGGAVVILFLWKAMKWA